MYDWTLTRDNAGRIKRRVETIQGSVITWDYAYDNLGNLKEAQQNGSVVESYTYDANGNRLTETNVLRGISNQTYTYSNEDNVITAGTNTYQFDKDGFLTGKTAAAGTTTFHYSSRGELLNATLPDGRDISYDHDPIGRRIAKRINGTIMEKYLWQGMTRLLAVYDGTNNLVARFTYADDRMPISMTQSGSTYYLAYDQVGSLRAVMDSTGLIVKQVDYDAFGSIINDSNSGIVVPFGFAGGLHDRDTGLVRFGYRDYDPVIGTFISKDPIGFRGGLNLYAYVGNNPVNRKDPSGLSFLLYNSDTETLTLYNNFGFQVDQFPAGNNTATGPNSNGPWPNGAYPYSYYVPHPESGPTGKFGSNGNFVFDVPGCEGCGVHSGRNGPQSLTNGCIRTTDPGTQTIKDLNATDPLTHIIVCGGAIPCPMGGD